MKTLSQVGCLRLMGRKLLVSMALEGKFSESGLQSMDDGADVLTTLARELVMNQGVGRYPPTTFGRRFKHNSLRCKNGDSNGSRSRSRRHSRLRDPIGLHPHHVWPRGTHRAGPAQGRPEASSMSSHSFDSRGRRTEAVAQPKQHWRSLWRVKHNCRFRRRSLRR